MTWTILNITENYIDIKLKFSSPEEVSPGFEQDILIIHFKDSVRHCIRAIGEDHFLRNNTMQIKAKKQMEDNEFN